MKRNFTALIFFLATMITACANSSNGDSGPADAVITDIGTCYQVELKLNGGTHYQLGQAYGSEILAAVPNIESLLDSYIDDVINSNDTYYAGLIARVTDIKPQLHQSYRDEIEGMASQLSGTANVRGDDKISEDELYAVNLFPDIARTTQCSAVSVFGDLSATGKNITGRILDWEPGSENQLPKIQAITTIRNGSKTIVTVGYLGYMGIITGFNDNKVFAAIMDSGTGETYSSSGKNSYTFDLRYALETFSTLTEVADYMKDASRDYTYGHLIWLSDPDISRVVENDLRDASYRRVRSSDSTLNTGVTPWPSPSLNNAIGAVNSFVLNDSLDNHTGRGSNYNRWSSMITELSSRTEGGVTVAELQNVISFDGGDGPGSTTAGDLYNSSTQQVVVFQPDSLTLDIYFIPKTGTLHGDPVFQTFLFDL